MLARIGKSPIILRLTALLLCLPLFGCEQPAFAILEVSATAGVARELEVMVFLGETQALERHRITLPEGKSGIDFALRLPPRLVGKLIIGIGGRDAGGCLTAAGTTQIDWPARSNALIPRYPIIVDGLKVPDCDTGSIILNRLTPESVLRTNGGDIVLNGFGFRPTSKVMMGGQQIPSVWVSPTELLATVPSASLAVGVTSIWVQEGDELSAQLSLHIQAKQIRLSQILVNNLPIECSDIFTARLGDITGDGWDDMVIVCAPPSSSTEPSQIHIFKNDHSGHFDHLQTVKVAQAFQDWQIELADLNADHRMDVVALNFSPGQYLVWLSQGSSGLGTPTTYEIGAGWGLAITTGDIDGDGDADVAGIVTCKPAPGRCLDIRRSENGTLLPSQFFGIPGALRLRLAPTKAESPCDLFLISNPEIEQLINDGHGVFSRQSIIIAKMASDLTRIDFGKLTGDQTNDLALVSPQNPVTTYRLSEAVPSVEAWIRFPCAGQCTDLRIADIDGDGGADILVLDSFGSFDVVRRSYLNSQPYSIRHRYGITVESSFFIAGVADLDHDGRLDIVLNATTSPVSVSILHNISE